MCEREIASIEGALPYDQAAKDTIEGLAKDTVLVFQCHHGMRSMGAAQSWMNEGYTKVFNLQGGIHAWSTHVDPMVPTY